MISQPEIINALRELEKKLIESKMDHILNAYDKFTSEVKENLSKVMLQRTNKIKYKTKIKNEYTNIWYYKVL